MEFIKAKNYRKNIVVLSCPFCGESEEIYLEQQIIAAEINNSKAV